MSAHKMSFSAERLPPSIRAAITAAAPRLAAIMASPPCSAARPDDLPATEAKGRHRGQHAECTVNQPLRPIADAGSEFCRATRMPLCHSLRARALRRHRTAEFYGAIYKVPD
jgi:hypothetical protein